MNIPALKDNKEYMAFLSELPDMQELILEQNKLKKQVRAFKKEVQKKRRRINTIIHKYTFLNDIVGIGATGKKLSLDVKKALKGVGFKEVHHIDNLKREDVRLIHNNDIVLFEVTGLTGGAQRKKGFQTIVNTMVARNSGKERVHGCLLINHNNDKVFTARKKNPFTDREMNIDVEAGEISLLTTVTLRTMLIDIIKGNLTIDQFIEKLFVVGVVKYNPD